MEKHESTLDWEGGFIRGERSISSYRNASQTNIRGYLEQFLVIPNLAMLSAMASQQENGATSNPGPTIFSIVQALGMKLDSTKGTVETLIIDYIERPTEN
jgi:uncharacterized protein (TIGR03435 family)